MPKSGKCHLIIKKLTNTTLYFVIINVEYYSTYLFIKL